MSEPDVAIVGAGAAGISAGRRLRALGKSVLLIDALPRLGGRAHTQILQDMPLDMGAHWLHSGERNPLTALAESHGEKIERRRAAWGQQWRDIGATRETQHGAWRAYENFIERLHSNPPASDRAGDAIAQGDRWRPFADAISTYVNGVELDQLSVADFFAIRRRRKRERLAPSNRLWCIHRFAWRRPARHPFDARFSGFVWRRHCARNRSRRRSRESCDHHRRQ